MRIRYIHPIVVGLITILLTGSVFSIARVASAQSGQFWSEPVNVSKSGSSTDPVLIIDSVGAFHVIWADSIEGYKYVESVDGSHWTSPKNANFPFLLEDNPRPTFSSNSNGIIYIFWQDAENVLYYGEANAESLINSSLWSQRSRIADSVMAYNAVVDNQGVLHLSYVKSLGDSSGPAGVYYAQITSSAAHTTTNIYGSEYFRSLDSTTAHVRIALSNPDTPDEIYIVWDDRPQKRIFLAKSVDAGKSWGEPAQIVGPEAITGLATAFNIDVGVIHDKVLLTWQIGQPGDRCTQYSQWSDDGGEQFGQPVKISDQLPLCAHASQLIGPDNDFSIALFNILDDMALVAWDGSGWSEPQTQNEIAAFLNPVTLDSVILGCQKSAFHGSMLYIVGCDRGNGGDIWFSSRSLGSVKDWFPPSSAWSMAKEVTSVDQKISGLTSVADDENNVHAFWVQTPALNRAEGIASIQYARWNGITWSDPIPVRTGSDANPVQLTAQADSLERLSLSWIDGITGDLIFRSTNVAHANSAFDWQGCQCVPSPSQATSSPDILVDDGGLIILAYAIPINESRGLYFVESTDGGLSWSPPFQIFDAESAGWGAVDAPVISLTGDGRLHVLFTRYDLNGPQRHSIGLYYSQSADGGVTWISPERVSENPILWSDIMSYGRSTLHRLWQENKGLMLVMFHQVSDDGGATWSTPTIASSIDAGASLTAQTIDGAGNLHLLQLSDKDIPVLVSGMWNGSAWIAGAPKELYIPDQGVPSSMTASMTSGGNLFVGVSVDYPSLTDGVLNSILSMHRLLDISKDTRAQSPVIVPTAGAMQVSTENASELLQSPTQSAPAAALYDSPSSLTGQKNLVGVLLLGAILVMVILLFLPALKKQGSSKKTAR